MNNHVETSAPCWYTGPAFRLATFVVISIVAVLVSFQRDLYSTALVWITEYGAFLVTAEIGVLLLLVWKLLRDRTGAQRNKTPFLIYGLLALLFVFSVTREPAGFKIVDDEVILSATAMNIHYNGEVKVPALGYEILGRYELLGGRIDKRPIGFSVLLSLVHDIFGYRIGNVFFLNIVLTALVSLALFHVAKAVSDERAALLSVSMFLLTPLVAQNATGGGFEILNVFMLLLSMWLGIRYLEAPGSWNIVAFCLSVLLLSQTRYESIVFLLPAVAVVLIGWHKSHRIVLPWGVLVIPLLFVPLVIHLQMPFYDQYWWELHGNNTPPFGKLNFLKNLGASIAYLFSLRRDSSSNFIFSAIGVGALVLMLVGFARVRRERQIQAVAIDVVGIFCIGITLHFCIVLFFYAGDLTKLSSSRYVLPLMLGFSLATAFVVGRRLQSKAAASAIVAGLLCSSYVFSLPAFARTSGTNSDLWKKRTEWILDYCASLPKGDDLLVTNEPWIFMLHKLPVTQLEGVNDRADYFKYHLDEDSFDNIIIAQNFGMDPETRERIYRDRDALDSRFRLEEVGRIRLSPYEYARMSMLTGVDLGAKENGRVSQKVFHGDHFMVDKEVLAEWYKHLW